MAEMTIGEVYDNMTPEQKETCHYVVGLALERPSDTLHLPTPVWLSYIGMPQPQKYVLHFLCSEALKEKKSVVLFPTIKRRER